MNADLTLWSWGRTYNPINWFHNPHYLVNRIYYICGGTAYYRKDHKLKKGYLYIIPANPDFAVSQDPRDPVDHIFFDFYSLAPITRSDYMEIDLSQMSSLHHILLAAMEDFKDISLSRVVGPAYFTIITSLLQNYIDSEIASSEITRKALRFIRDNNIAEISVNCIADHIGVHVNHLIRCFRKDVGHTPHQYIAMLKLDMATDRLSRGDSVAEVADALGYSSVAAFSGFFKKERHISPSLIASVRKETRQITK